MPNSSYDTGASALLGGSLLFTLIITVAAIVFGIIIWWRIFSKAGYSGAMSLLLFIPIANLIVICMLAFAEWPMLKELNQLRQAAAQRQQYPNPQYQNPNAQYQNPQYQNPNVQYQQNPQYQNPQYQNPQYPGQRQ